MRKFSVPYNNSNPDEYLKAILPFKNSIENIYFSYPGVGAHVTPDNLINNLSDAYEYTQGFLTQTKGVYKRILAVNTCFIPLSDTDKQAFIINTLLPILLGFEIEGIIISDFTLARLIHQMIPNLEIHTSCNTYQFNEKTYEYWYDEAGISVFNPPRESLRNPQLLKNIKSDKWKIKCLVNEACLYGCPQNINHACYLSVGSELHTAYFCNRSTWRYSDILRTNFILPRWLKYFDDIVDIYKLSGRACPTEKIVDMLDAYINERNDVNLLRIITWRVDIQDSRFIIPVNRVPDKLLDCKCSDCDSCKICENVVRKCLSNIPLEELRYEI